jgi:hypothetical protein
MRNLIAMQDRSAIPAERVVTVVEHALTARRARTRYLVGFNANLMASLHRLLPDRAFDGLLSMFTRRVAGGPASEKETA